MPLAFIFCYPMQLQADIYTYKCDFLGPLYFIKCQ